MKISNIICAEKPSLSFEVFPPKSSDGFEQVANAAHAISDLAPSYISVTYGAGGTTCGFTFDIAEQLLKNGTTPLVHLSCISATRETIHAQLTDLKKRGIENILALRGDLPKGVAATDLSFRYASDLTKEIREFGGFCIGGACYPESHPESPDSATDIDYLKVKVENGCEFLTTQMFFDNNVLYNFLYRMMRAGLNVPVVAGIMPVTNGAQIKRICSISGSALPQRFIRIVDRYGNDPAAMKQAGIAYATEQIIDLYANGINAVHIYSMNKPDVAEAIKANLSEIIK
ncbi:MAG: methylenetetrahydrofolate reductase [Clostridia bacterium]|nr:methylenetetrahydrofolate reductase [Clostridia bacterium]